MKMDAETNDLIARLYLAESNFGTVEPREFADWAVKKLEEGLDSKNIRILASEFDAKRLSDVEGHFRKSIADLNWEFPSLEVSTERYLESIMRKIVDSEISPSDGCRELYYLCTILGYPKTLYNWNGIFWASEDLDPQSWNALIREEAQRWLEGDETEVIHESFLRRPVNEQSSSFWARLKNLMK